MPGEGLGQRTGASLVPDRQARKYQTMRMFRLWQRAASKHRRESRIGDGIRALRKPGCSETASFRTGPEIEARRVNRFQEPAVAMARMDKALAAALDEKPVAKAADGVKLPGVGRRTYGQVGASAERRIAP
jgi:hypothetical protein